MFQSCEEELRNSKENSLTRKDIFKGPVPKYQYAAIEYESDEEIFFGKKLRKDGLGEYSSDGESSNISRLSDFKV